MMVVCPAVWMRRQTRVRVRAIVIVTVMTMAAPEAIVVGAGFETLNRLGGTRQQRTNRQIRSFPRYYSRCSGGRRSMNGSRP